MALGSTATMASCENLGKHDLRLDALDDLTHLRLPWNREGTLAVASNVTRICRALLPKSDDGVQQIVYYQGGLGSQDSFWSYLFGGFLGAGISENVREAYAFLCNVSEEGTLFFHV